jgi:hypothetical protein
VSPRPRLQKLVSRPGLGPASLTALCVLGGMFLLGILRSVFVTLEGVTLTGGLGVDLAALAQLQLVDAATGPLPFAIGVLLSIWQLAPIGPELRLVHVVTRALLASAAGAAVSWLVFYVVTVVADSAENSGGVGPTRLVESLGREALPTLFQGLANAVAGVPFAVLAAIFLWGWMQRHPVKTVLRGMLDEV